MLEVEGNLIQLALTGKYDVITHCCNCFCVQGAGVAKAMNQVFKTLSFPLEQPKYKGAYKKLGNIDSRYDEYHKIHVVNSYAQYNYGRVGRNLDYSALKLCLQKINHFFKGKKLITYRMGCSLAGGDWQVVKKIMENTLTDMDVTIVTLPK